MIPNTVCGALSNFHLYVCWMWLSPVFHSLTNTLSPCYRKPLTRGGRNASLLPGGTHAACLLALSSSTTKCSAVPACTTPSAPHTPRVVRQTTISNPEDLEVTRVQVLASCLKCSSYPQLTDSQLQMLTREGSLSGRHKWWTKLKKKQEILRLSGDAVNTSYIFY